MVWLRCVSSNTKQLDLHKPLIGHFRQIYTTNFVHVYQVTSLYASVILQCTLISSFFAVLSIKLF